MKKFAYIAAAVGTLALALPSIANAETIVVKHGGGHHWGHARAEMRDHGWHRGGGWHHHDRVVVVKRHRY